MVWALDVEHDVWALDAGKIKIRTIIKNEKWGWTLISPKKFKKVDVGFNSHVVGLDMDGNVFYRTQITSSNPKGVDWDQMITGS